MLGAILIVVALLAIPSLVLMGGMAAAVAIGEVLKRDAESRYAGSELLDLDG